MLEELFRALLAGYGIEVSVIEQLWTEILVAYEGPGRYYHKLSHLEHLLALLLPLKNQLSNWDAILLAICYHDIVYDPLAKDNEAQSALLAEERMLSLQIQHATLEQTKALIHATQSHASEDTPDIAFFLDADLAILGAPESEYDQYAASIRNEYRIVPDQLYMPGRRQVLEHFRAMPALYKTAHFRRLYEEQARRNINRELSRLC